MFTDAAKNTMLDALTIDGVRLHSGDPGASGTANQVGDLESATFAAASGGERALSSTVAFTGLTGSQTVTYFSAWNGATFVCSAAITGGDTTANAAGEYSLTTQTKLALTDPA